MPAKKDFSIWQETEGDHADDTTYVRVPLSPTEPPTDEARTADEVGAPEDD